LVRVVRRHAKTRMIFWGGPAIKRCSRGDQMGRKSTSKRIFRDKGQVSRGIKKPGSWVCGNKRGSTGARSYERKTKRARTPCKRARDRKRRENKTEKMVGGLGGGGGTATAGDGSRKVRGVGNSFAGGKSTRSGLGPVRGRGTERGDHT